jgi:hypothetical protein
LLEKGFETGACKTKALGGSIDGSHRRTLVHRTRIKQLRHAEACGAPPLTTAQRQALDERRADVAALRRQLSGVPERLQQQQQQQQQPHTSAARPAMGSSSISGGIATNTTSSSSSSGRVAPPSSSDAHRARALAMTERLQASSARLQDGRRQLAEAEVCAQAASSLCLCALLRLGAGMLP